MIQFGNPEITCSSVTVYFFAYSATCDGDKESEWWKIGNSRTNVNGKKLSVVFAGLKV
jgi:hypothetical protein